MGWRLEYQDNKSADLTAIRGITIMNDAEYINSRYEVVGGKVVLIQEYRYKGYDYDVYKNSSLPLIYQHIQEQVRIDYLIESGKNIRIHN